MIMFVSDKIEMSCVNKLLFTWLRQLRAEVLDVFSRSGFYSLRFTLRV